MTNMTSRASSYERRQAYLEAELAANRRPGNGRAEVFNQLVRLELGRGPLDLTMLNASTELIRRFTRCGRVSTRLSVANLGWLSCKGHLRTY